MIEKAKISNYPNRKWKNIQSLPEPEVKKYSSLPEPEGENFLAVPGAWRTVLQVAEEFSDSDVKTSSPLRSWGIVRKLTASLPIAEISAI
jgi:hypothetical protein